VRRRLFFNSFFELVIKSKKKMGFTEVFALVAGTISYCVWVYYNTDMEWASMPISVLISSQFPHLIPVSALAIFRLFCAVIIWSSLVYIVFDREGLEITFLGKNKTKRTVRLFGLSRLTMFTVWSWILQGFYFAFTALSAFASLHRKDYPALYKFCSIHLTWISWALFEISFPVSFLVSGVVTYALIPFAKAQNLPTDTFFKPMAILMHNANILFMAIEFTVNELHFSFHHYIYMLIYGLAYIIFSWIWNKYRNILYYFFLDFNRSDALLWHIGLLAGILLLFFGGYYLSSLEFHQHGMISTGVSSSCSKLLFPRLIVSFLFSFVQFVALLTFFTMQLRP
jgi:hypothetical protein